MISCRKDGSKKRKNHKFQWQEDFVADQLFISVSLENAVARKMFGALGFRELKEIEYTCCGTQYREMQMVKDL